MADGNNFLLYCSITLLVHVHVDMALHILHPDPEISKLHNHECQVNANDVMSLVIQKLDYNNNTTL